MDGRCSSPGEMMESSGRVTPFSRPPMSAAVDSNTAMPSSSLDRTPHGDARDNAITTCWVTELRFWDHRAVKGKWNLHQQVYQVYLVSWCKGSTFIYTHTRQSVRKGPYINWGPKVKFAGLQKTRPVFILEVCYPSLFSELKSGLMSNLICCVEPVNVIVMPQSEMEWRHCYF